MQTTDTQPARGAAPAPGQNPGGGGAPSMPQQALNPQQIRQLQVMSKQAMSFLLEETTAKQIVQRAQQGDAKQVVAETVLAVMRRLYEAAQDAGQDVDMVTLMVTGIQIIGELTEMLAAAGVVPEDVRQQAQFVAEVSKIAVDQHNSFVQQQGGAPAQQPQPGAQA